jgi:hypothetical protein
MKQGCSIKEKGTKMERENEAPLLDMSGRCDSTAGRRWRAFVIAKEQAEVSEMR